LRNCADVLQSLQRHAEALAHYDRLPAAIAASEDICLARAKSLSALGHTEAALIEYRKAISTRADDPRSLVGAGYLLYHTGRISEARDLFERALRVDAGYPYLAGLCLHAALAASDWEGFEARVLEVNESVRSGRQCMDPCAFLAVSESPRDQLACAT